MRSLENDLAHKLIIAKAKEHFDANGMFYFNAVLSESPFAEWPDYIEWWFVKKTIEKEIGETLMPIIRNVTHDPQSAPERFLPARGHPAEGFSRVEAQPQEVGMTWAERRYHNAAGAWHSLERVLATCQAAGLPITYTPTALPALSFTPAPAAE